MKNTVTKTRIRNTWPIGSLPYRKSPKFAALMREISKSNPSLAHGIREQLQKAQAAEKMVRRLLARHRLNMRQVPVLDFFGKSKR
ncbi:MAG: hypothetical protein HQ519_05400 [Planctomycetes bacterium]|nr:hypothetical protein [Planctomycetota bacterium]